MADRHAVELSYDEHGKRSLLIDGEPVKGVRSVHVALLHNDLPTVHVELIPGALRVFYGAGANVEMHELEPDDL